MLGQNTGPGINIVYTETIFSDTTRETNKRG